MQYTNFLGFLLTSPALLSLTLAAPTPIAPGSFERRVIGSDGTEPIAGESVTGQLRRIDYPHLHPGIPVAQILPDSEQSGFHKRQVAVADIVAMGSTPNTDTNPPPKPAPAPGSDHAAPGNSASNPGSNGGLTPEQRQQQGNRIQAGIAHDDTHKRQVAVADIVAMGPTPNTDTNPPPKPAPAPGNGHATPGNSASNPGSNSESPAEEKEIDNTVQASIAHDDTP